MYLGVESLLSRNSTWLTVTAVHTTHANLAVCAAIPLTGAYHVLQVKAVTEEMGLSFMGIGFQPKWKIEDIPIMPKVCSLGYLRSWLLALSWTICRM